MYDRRASPMSVIVIASASALVTLPPTMSVPDALAASVSPAYRRSKKRAPSPGRIARLTTHAVGNPPIAAISLKFTVKARAPRISGREPLKLEMHPLDHRIDRHQLRLSRRRQDRAVVAGTEDRPTALTQLRRQPSDKLEFSGRFTHCARRAMTNGMADWRMVRGDLPRGCKSLENFRRCSRCSG